MMKCRMCRSVICSVVPSYGSPAVLCGSFLTRWYCSSSAPSWLVSSLSGWEMPIVRALITISPIFSSGDIRATRSAARWAGVSRQSSYGSTTPLAFRSRKARPSASMTGFTRAAMSICFTMGLSCFLRIGVTAGWSGAVAQRSRSGNFPSARMRWFSSSR